MKLWARQPLKEEAGFGGKVSKDFKEDLLYVA